MSHTTSDARKRAADTRPPVSDIYGIAPDYADQPPTVPRVAQSLDDLTAGQVVAWNWRGEEWTIHTVGERDADTNYAWTYDGGGITEATLSRAEVVILQDAPDPPARDWLVPATQMEALKAAFDRWLRTGSEEDFTTWVDETNAVLDAAREVEHE